MSEVISAMLAHTQGRHTNELKDIAWRTANSSQTGFKKSMSIHEIHTINARQKIITMPRYHGKMLDMSQGALQTTNNKLHAAVSGAGLFTVQTPDGRQILTRRGNFHTNANNELVTAEEYLVLGEGGPITLDPVNGPYNFNKDGTISNQAGPIDRFLIQTVGPEDYFSLRDIGGYFIYPDEVTPIPAENFMVQQGAIEHSNVHTAQEAANIANASQRAAATKKYASEYYERRKKMVADLGKINV